MRIGLARAKPPIWRRVEVPSTLMLDAVHDAIQVLFSWSDEHLHRFALGDAVWDRAAEASVSAYDKEEGEQDGVPKRDVRLDEVLAAPGDVLHDVYDYGDNRIHTIKLEKVLAGVCGRPRVLAGRHEAPEEDSGGIGTWDDDPCLAPLDIAELDEELADSAADPGSPPDTPVDDSPKFTAGTAAPSPAHRPQRLAGADLGARRRRVPPPRQETRWVRRS